MNVADRTRLTERVPVMMSKHMKGKVVKVADEQGVAIAEVIRVAVEEYLEKKTK